MHGRGFSRDAHFLHRRAPSRPLTTYGAVRVEVEGHASARLPIGPDDTPETVKARLAGTLRALSAHHHCPGQRRGSPSHRISLGGTPSLAAI